MEFRPSCTPAALKARAQLNAQIREFFSAKGVLEVEVPLLSQHFVTDPFIQPICVSHSGHPGFLQSSPEYAMKRLLAVAPQCIYSLGKAFRCEETSSRHNPEFTLLEWYRLGLDDRQLMDEVAELVGCIMPGINVSHISYQQWFENGVGLNPHTASLSDLAAVGHAHITIESEGLNRDDWLDLLITHKLEQQMPPGLTFIYDYPQSQAALARVLPDANGQPVARRFEAFINGMELANGYWELTDVNEQRRRFASDRAKRKALGFADIAPDERLLAALDAGLPDCAGVALGVDRLLMQSLGAPHIRDVITFAGDLA